MKKKTFSTKAKDIKRQWKKVDLKGKILGRSAAQIAVHLIGKNKPYYSPHLDCGDYVVVTNASKVKVTGKKTKNKMYYRHSGYPGGLKKFTYQQMMDRDPRKIVELAVKGMLPKNKLRKKRLRRMKVFTDDQHPFKDKLKKTKKN